MSEKSDVRLDKYMSDYAGLTRSQAKKEIRSGRVLVNGAPVKTGEVKVSNGDAVLWNGQAVCGRKYEYIMLNKPSGIVSATVDDRDETVVEYFERSYPGTVRGLFPAGRLDKDTEGLLLLTNDGELAHRILSPKHHVEKEYFVRLNKELAPEDAERICGGLDIGERHITRPAKLKILSSTECFLTITEGKFHQVKRMFAQLGKKVIYLKRIRMGTLRLDETLDTGEWRFLTEKEIEDLKGI